MSTSITCANNSFSSGQEWVARLVLVETHSQNRLDPSVVAILDFYDKFRLTMDLVRYMVAYPEFVRLRRAVPSTKCRSYHSV